MVWALTNVALQKETFQSVTDGFWDGRSSKAVDGNTDGNFYSHGNKYKLNSVTHGTGTNPQWRVELGNMYKILNVRIFNRSDCCQYRLNGFTLTICNGINGISWEKTNIPVGRTQNIIDVPVPKNTTGTSVTISLDRYETLSLAEVEVYGYLAS